MWISFVAYSKNMAQEWCCVNAAELSRHSLVKSALGRGGDVVHLSGRNEGPRITTEFVGVRGWRA